MEEMKKQGTLPAPAQKDDPLPPLKTFHIPKGAFDNMPMMMQKIKEGSQEQQTAP